MFGDRTIRYGSYLVVTVLLAGMAALVAFWVLYQQAISRVNEAYQSRYNS